jgi:hypothetical protein
MGDIQRNAIESWRALRPDVQIILVGDEEGVEEAAREAGVEHSGSLERNDRGTPRLDSAFECAARLSRRPLWCFVNADIILLDDFLRAVERVTSAFSDFLVVGESRDLDVGGRARLGDPTVREHLRERARTGGRLRGYAALDYFVFRRGLFDPVPPFLIGRACFDNWLVWRARELGHPVVDVTRSVVVVHQSHDYSHVAGGLDEAYYGEEARYNERLAGGREHIYSLHEATHRLHRQGPAVPYWGSRFRMREKARLARMKMEIHLTARRDRAPFQARPFRLLGVFPAPTAESTALLNALSQDENLELKVLYPSTPSDDDSWTRSARHVHWFARTTRLARLDRLVGREYPITWSIWHSFYFMKPDCMLISGWNTFPAQAAIAWCMAWRVPYFLLADEPVPQITVDGSGSVSRALADAVKRRSAAVLPSDVTDKRVRALLDLSRQAQESRTARSKHDFGTFSRTRRAISRHARTRRSRSSSLDRRR